MKKLIVSTLCYTLSVHYASAQSANPSTDVFQQYSSNQTNQSGYKSSEARYNQNNNDNEKAAEKKEESRIVYNDFHGSDFKF